ncbi:MAG TPA: DUF3320 domain-containing protein [Ramlibacter sp.]|jgi:very-short-patch-repair endonuclease
MTEEFKLSGSIADHISIAFYQNEIPVITELAFENNSEQDLSEIVLRVESEPPFLTPTSIRIDGIRAQSKRHVSPVDLRLDAAFLRQLKEGVRGVVRVVASQGGADVAVLAADIQVHPPSHWGGTAAAPELLAAFVRPNDSAVDVILHDAAARLAAAGRQGAINGYSGGTRERAWELANAIWAAIAGHGIAYVMPPASFERSGQKVRSPGDILERRTGTCLDLALLYAACLEQAGLNAVLVLTQGHAFVGLWLRKEDFPSVAFDDMQILRKRRDLEDLIFIETTFLTHTPPGPFAAAVKHGRTLVEEGASALEVAVDISRARARHIRPLELGDAASMPLRPNVEMARVELQIEEPPAFTSEVIVREDPDTVLDRLERWKRKLLDLSLRNKLLNFKDTKKAVALECPEPAKLEDMLTGGTRFKLFARSDVLSGEDTRDQALFIERHHDDGRKSYLLQALDRQELHTSLTELDLDNRLTDLFRVTRTAFEEGGSNILFLAIGFLKWTQKDKGPALRAPLLLVPVTLQRSSIRAGFRLALHDEEVRFNPTLLQMLRQDFKLSLPELDGELPTDGAGIDVARILHTVRTHIKDLQGWEVTADVVLSTFSFTKFLMWRDLVERMDLLKRNPVVRHLIDTPKHQYGDGSPFPVPAQLDRNYHPSEIFAPLSADSSQLAAVLAAASGKDFVLFGPPGTGKSQTIANMISQCLASGKTVLFVSQKTAALEVVQRRLRDIGLGEYCLEVHSTKAQKSAVLGQLKQAWHERSMPTANDWELATGNLASLRDELNQLVSALHRRRSNGMTAHTAFGRVTANRDRFPGLKFGWPVTEHRESDLSAMRQICKDLRPILGAVGDAARHPLRGMDATAWDPFWRPKMEAAIDGLVASLEAVGPAAESFATPIGLPPPTTLAGVEALRDFGSFLLDADARLGTTFLGKGASAIAQAVVSMHQLQSKLAAERGKLTGSYRSLVFKQNLTQILSEWTDACQANFILRGSRQKRVLLELQPFATGQLPEDIGADLAALIEMQGIVRSIEALKPAFAGLAGFWSGIDTDLTVLNPALAWAKCIRASIGPLASAINLPADDLSEYVVRLHSEYADLVAVNGNLAGEHARFSAQLDELRESEHRLGQLVDPLSSWALPEGEGWVADTLGMLARWRSGLHTAQAWVQWNLARRRGAEVGLDILLDAVEAGEVAPDALEQAFEVAYARWWSDIVVAEDPLLRTFLAARQEETVARFRAADERVADLSKRIVRARLSGSIPAPTAFGTDPEWGTLARELQKRAKHQPLRQLFSNIPTILTKLTPCVMMSPLSIAQYLPADAKPFDVVIFDEASQIPVWDAIGAIARGNQVVIVGDPEQLPPTSVGERGVDEIEDGSDVEDQESILDESLASNIPPQRLDWHYRSRHESLIAFSNNAYYKGRLVTFPSPVTEDRAVRYVHVPGGIYERGKARVNRSEARAVVEEVVRRLKEPDFTRDRLSIGVVTFNGEQMRLIENLLDQARRSEPEIEPFFDTAQWHEPVFVKNLENVQGDERDIILFSVAVGPDETGRTVSTISSLNKEGGHRRLNVAITRARQEMVVFATLRPEQIDLSKTGARGVREFKHFLEYAERGARAIAEAFAPTGGETESPFEDAVKDALEKQGWVVHPQVGVSSFRVDLGIVHPDAPGRYIAGVECDGATYHRSATARDRDRLREHILRNLGWNIHRVWSTDWWMNMDAAVNTLHISLEADLAASRQEAERRTAATTTPTESRVPDLVRPGSDLASKEAEEDFGASGAEVGASVVQPHLVATTLAPIKSAAAYADLATPSVPVSRPTSLSTSEPHAYTLAVIAGAGLVPDPARFYDADYRPQLRSMVALILAAEAPIYEDLLFQRVSREHGFAQAGGSIRTAIAAAIERVVQVTVDDDRRLVWPIDREPTIPVSFRMSAPEVRGHADIPICELASLARVFLAQGGNKDEVMRRMASHFGLGRLRSATQERFGRAFDLVAD